MTQKPATTEPRVARSRWARLRGPATALLAALLYALLIDTAVETWQAASPMRDWVALPVVLYVAYTLWLLPQPASARPPASASVWVSTFLFLALLAFTATLTGGFANGVRVAGASTPQVFAAASVAVILLAGFSLASSPLPLPVRGLAAAASLYGVVAFVAGLAARRSYVELLQGRSVWERLPYWSQGAFVGALIVVPLAFVVEVGIALAVLKVRGRLHRLVAFALQVVFAYYACVT